VEFMPEPAAVNSVSFWAHPSAWLREKNHSRGFWVFFTAAFFFDAGFSIYVFLFNLYLLDFHFNEQSIGLISGAMTLGSLVGTLPAGVVTRRIGLRPVLIFCFVASSLLGTLRTIWMWFPAQAGLAFLAGLAMCTWGVCFLPAIARLTTEKNRTSGFSLIFSVSVGTSALGGIICGYLQQWLRMAGIAMEASQVKRLILQVSCAVALIGLAAVLRLRVPPQQEELSAELEAAYGNWFQRWRLRPFLFRFLISMALWTVVLGAFTPFANVYLSRDLHIPLTRIGLIFSAVQIVQLFTGLLTPIVFRKMGLVNGIMATQFFTALVLGLLAGARNGNVAIALYLCFAAAQWMSAPGLYNLLMDQTPDKERSTAAAMTLFCNALAGSAATAMAGILFTHFGYPPVLFGIAMLAIGAALLLRVLITPQPHSPALPKEGIAH
jgi:MFS family permease